MGVTLGFERNHAASISAPGRIAGQNQSLIVKAAERGTDNFRQSTLKRESFEENPTRPSVHLIGESKFTSGKILPHGLARISKISG